MSMKRQNSGSAVNQDCRTWWLNSPPTQCARQIIDCRLYDKPRNAASVCVRRGASDKLLIRVNQIAEITQCMGELFDVKTEPVKVVGDVDHAGQRPLMKRQYFALFVARSSRASVCVSWEALADAK